MRIQVTALILLLLIFEGCRPAPQTRQRRSAGSDGAPDISAVTKHLRGEPVIPRRANTLYIAPFGNRTSSILPNAFLRLHLEEFFLKEGRLAPVKSETGSHLRLDVTYLTYAVQALGYNDFGVASKKRLHITAAVTLTDQKEKKAVFQKVRIQAFTLFSETTPPLMTERQAREKLLKELAERIGTQILKGWYTDKMTEIEKG